jgi:hypothetical protein
MQHLRHDQRMQLTARRSSFEGAKVFLGRSLGAMHVQSQLIEAIAYDEKAHLLRAKFRDSGETITYENVPQDIYDGLIFAHSISGYFHDYIEGHFPCRH